MSCRSSSFVRTWIFDPPPPTLVCVFRVSLWFPTWTCPSGSGGLASWSCGTDSCWDGSKPCMWEEESLLLWIQTKRISIGGKPTHRIQPMEPGDGPRTTQDVNFEDKDGRGRLARSKRDRFDRMRRSFHPSSNGRKEPWEGERTNVPCTCLRTTTVNNVPQDLCLRIHAKNVTMHRRTHTSISLASKTYPSFNPRNKRRKSMPFTTVDEGCAKQ